MGGYISLGGSVCSACSVGGYTSLNVSACSACSVGEYTPQQGSVGSRSETVVQTCAERGEVAFCVVDVLEGGLQCDVAVQLATVCQLNGVLGALTEASALSRQSALVEAIAVGAAYLGIPVAGTLVTGVLRVLRMHVTQRSAADHTGCSAYAHQAQVVLCAAASADGISPSVPTVYCREWTATPAK